MTKSAKSRIQTPPMEVSAMLYLWTILAVVSILAVMTMGLAGCQADDVADDVGAIYDTGPTVYEAADAGEPEPPSIVTLTKDESLCGNASDMATYQREVSERLNATHEPLYECGHCVYSTCATAPFDGAPRIPSGGGYLWTACPIRAECLGY